MSKLLELVQNERWDEAFKLFSDMIEKGQMDDEGWILGATTMQNLGQSEAMYVTICSGLAANPRNYELYLMLGDYYASINPDQAYLCYENALYHARNKGTQAEEDAKAIKDILDEFVRSYTVKVRRVSFIILSYNTLEYTQRCIQSIRDNCNKDSYEIIVVDNASVDGSVEWLMEQEDVLLQRNEENVGFPAGCNQGIRMADKENDIFLLNNDTLMLDNSLYTLRMGLYGSDKFGTAGAVTNYAANFQVAYDDSKNLEDYYRYAFEHNIPEADPYEFKSMLIMFAMIIKRDVFNIVGELDERFTPGNGEDSDYGLRILEAGFLNVLCWNSFIFHFGSKSFGKNENEFVAVLASNEVKFTEKWGFSPKYCTYAKADIVRAIDAGNNDEISVLEIGCGLGGTLGMIKRRFPRAKVYGIERSQKLLKLVEKMYDVKDISAIDEGIFTEKRFDYIIYGDNLYKTTQF
jgi:GT2 family glycosyltransferase